MTFIQNITAKIFCVKALKKDIEEYRKKVDKLEIEKYKAIRTSHEYEKLYEDELKLRTKLESDFENYKASYKQLVDKYSDEKRRKEDMISRGVKQATEIDNLNNRLNDCYEQLNKYDIRHKELLTKIKSLHKSVAAYKGHNKRKKGNAGERTDTNK